MSFRDCSTSAIGLIVSFSYNSLRTIVSEKVFKYVQNYWILPITSATSSSTMCATESGISIM